jgi:hypothetical protein
MMPDLAIDTGRLTLDVRGAEDAVITVAGKLGPAGGRRACVLLNAMLAAGVRRVIVDLSAVEAPPRSLTNAFAAVRDELRRRGGWLLVEGWSDVNDDVVDTLLEAINAYHEAV